MSDENEKKEALNGSMLDTIDPVNEPDVEREQEPEWQKAKHEVSEKNLDAADAEHPLNIQSGSTGSIKQKIEEEAVLDYLSDKIYGGPDSTVREYLANAETACVRAAELQLRRDADWEDDDFYAVDDDGERHKLPPSMIVQLARQEVGYEPTIEIEWHRDEDLLVFQDNGVGFTPREVTDVLAYTGRSGVRDRGDVSGQFGMGVLSAHKAVGKEGSYTLITRTRRDDVPEWAADGFAVYCYLGGYDAIEGSMPDGQYGTRFELPLKREDDEEYPFQNQHASRYQDTPVLREWIQKYSEWMRVPVLYHEYEDGETPYDDEFGEKEFAEDYDGAILNIEHEAFEAACYPSAGKETLLLSMPIERNYSYTPGNAPWQVDIRLRNENGIIVDGPNKGLMPIDEAEYRNMDDDRKEQFVVDSELTEEDVKLPQPDASRDTLQRNEQFWTWIGDTFQDLYNQKLADLAEELDDPDDLRQMAADRPNDFSFLMTGLSDFKSYRSSFDYDDFNDKVEKSLDMRFPDEVAKHCLLLQDSIEHCPRGKSGVSKKSYRTNTKIWKVYRKAADGGTVYMGCSINEDRCSVVWETHDHNHVVRVEDTSEYATYATLGFEKLKTVPTSSGSKNSDSFTIPDSLQSSNSSSTSNAGKDPKERTLTIRRDSGQRNSTKLTCEQIKSKLKEHDNDNGQGLKLAYNTYATQLILFPSGTEKNMSDWYGVSKPFSHRAVATCTVGAYEYLEDVPGVMHIDDLITDAKDVTLTTSEGDMTVEEAGDKLLVHVVDDEYIDRFRNETVMERLAEWVHDEIDPSHDFGYNYDTEDYPDSFIYAPVDRDAWMRLQPGNLDQQYIVIGGRKYAKGGTHTKNYNSDARLYALGRLTEWEDAEEIDALDQLTSNVEAETAFNVVDTLAMLHDNGIRPASLQPDGADGVEIQAVQQATMDDIADDDTEEEVATDGGDEEV